MCLVSATDILPSTTVNVPILLPVVTDCCSLTIANQLNSENTLCFDISVWVGLRLFVKRSRTVRELQASHFHFFIIFKISGEIGG